MILAAVRLFTAATSFPGLAALLPCLGAALVIHAGREGATATGRLLGLPPPARAWSDKLFALPLALARDRVRQDRASSLPFTPPVQIGIIGLSLALAIVSWALVEQPFQKLRPRTPRRTSLLAAAAAISAGLLVRGGAGRLAWLSESAHSGSTTARQLHRLRWRRQIPRGRLLPVQAYGPLRRRLPARKSWQGVGAIDGRQPRRAPMAGF